MTDFLLGVTAMGCLVVAAFFVRYWRSTGDRFFVLFALGFATFGANRVVLAALERESEARVAVYVVRLLAFLLIIAAVVDKNRASASP